MAEPQALNTAQPFVAKDGRLTHYAYNFLNRLWDRTGGFDDDVDASQATALFDSRSAAEIGQVRKDLQQMTRAVMLMGNDGLEAQIEEVKKSVHGLMLMLPELNSLNLGSLAPLNVSGETYTPSNETESRSFDADDAAGSISVPPTQAEVENIRDAVLALADVVATLINDLKAVGIIE